MADVTTYEPYLGYKFQVTIGGAGGVEIGFSSVEGLNSTSAVVNYREGNMPIWMRKFPGLIEWTPITMQRGASNSTFMFDWRSEVASYEDASSRVGTTGYGDGIVPPNYRRPITIELFGKGDSKNPGKRWTVYNAWPSEVRKSSLNAMGNEVLMESVIIQHEGLKEESPGTNRPSGA